MTELIETAIQRYVANGGSRCPWCDSNNISADANVKVEGGSAWQTINCADCGQRWNDLYTLTGVEEAAQ